MKNKRVSFRHALLAVAILLPLAIPSLRAVSVPATLVAIGGGPDTDWYSTKVGSTQTAVKMVDTVTGAANTDGVGNFYIQLGHAFKFVFQVNTNTDGAGTNLTGVADIIVSFDTNPSAGPGPGTLAVPLGFFGSTLYLGSSSTLNGAGVQSNAFSANSEAEGHIASTTVFVPNVLGDFDYSLYILNNAGVKFNETAAVLHIVEHPPTNQVPSVPDGGNSLVLFAGGLAGIVWMRGRLFLS